MYDALQAKKRQLLSQMMGGRAGGVAPAGGRIMSPGSPFGSQPHFGNPLQGLLAQYGQVENLAGIDPAALGAVQTNTGAPPAPDIVSQPWTPNASSGNDTGGTSWLMPASTGFGHGLNTPNPGAAALLNALRNYGGTSSAPMMGGFWRGMLS